MATFYIQLEDKLLQISGELTAENISKALGYVPVDSSTMNNYATKDEVSDLVDMSMVEELSQRVDNITFDSLKDNPFLQDGSGELNIVDESGNVIAKIDKEGLHSVDFIAGEHVLSEKANKNEIPSLSGYATEKFVTDKIAEAELGGEEVDLSEYAKKTDLEGLATEQWVEGQNYAKKDEIPSADFNSLENNPFAEDESGELNMTDESGNVGFKLNEQGLFVKDVVAGEHVLSNKLDATSLAKVATSGSYNDLTDKPTIPSAVTESTVSGWGFTKNTGTYSKPSGGIPKTDLASAVQDSLGKADTALQSYTEQYKGTVTGVKVNGTTKSPSSGIVDIGTVITSHQDISGKQDKLVSGTNIKTINGQSILGSGNITIEGGGNNSGSSDKKEVIYFDYDVLENMRPNVVYIIIDSDNVQISSFAPAVVNDDNRYAYDVFTAVVSLGTGGIESVSLTLPDYIYWANGAIPEVTEDYWELSISRITEYGGEGTDNYESYFAVLTPFKPVE